MTKPVRSSELFDCLITNLSDGTGTVAATHLSIEDHRHDNPEENPKEMGMILLVEDNAMNQLVGSRALGKLGYACDIANNGLEAVAALQSKRYDAVLMDCQMPEMDGYEATAEIRRNEGASRRTPIIAMTAAAMEGDREVCLAAGMDDYITKPVRLDTIGAALERWVPQPVSAQSLPAETNHASAVIPSGPLDHDQIELLRSLDDDGTVLEEIITQYLSQTTAGRGELARAAWQHDAPAIERATHTLRGASANVGATALVAVCAEIETQARTAQLDDAIGLMQRFDVEFARVRDALNLLTTKP